MATAALGTLDGEAGQEAESLRTGYLVQRAAANDPSNSASLQRHRSLGLTAIAAERRTLETFRADQRLGQDTYAMLQEELDWRALSLLPDEERRIEEG